MSIRKTLAILPLIALVAQQSATAQAPTADLDFEFSMGSVLNYRQLNTGTEFDGGAFNIRLRDGIIRLELAPQCVLPFYFPPGTPGCVPGADGFITDGDIDGDGLQDQGDYVIVASVTPAQFIAPFKPEKGVLVSAPPSLLPRPEPGFGDFSVSLFFDITTELIRQFDVTQYRLSRDYTAQERNLYDKEIVPGTYIFQFPSLINDLVPQTLAINRFSMLDGYRKKNNLRTGFRFLNVSYDEGFAVLNPFVINTIKWEGNNTTFITPQADILYFSIKPLINPLDPLSDPDFDSQVIFPNFTNTPGTVRVLLPNPNQTQYILPPNFLVPGQTGIIDLEFFVSRPTNVATRDSSIVRFRMPVRVSDPFNVPLNFGSSKTQNTMTADTDGDGHTNFAEWVFKSSRTDANSVPVFPFEALDSPPFNPPANGKSKSSKPVPEAMVMSKVSAASDWQFKIKKVINAVPKLAYTMQHSPDGVTWTTITPGDANWLLVDEYESVSVKAAAGNSNPNGYVRVHVGLAPKKK